MNLPTSSLMLSQTSSDSNRSNENTTSVKVSDFKNVNTQSENVKPDIKSAQSFSDFIKEKVNNSLTDSLALSLIISTY